MSISPHDESATAEDPGRSRGYCIPRSLTCAGRRAFEEEVRDIAAQLAQQLEVEAQRARRADPERTADDVRAARRAWARRIGEQARGDSASRSLAGTLLITLGGAGGGTMSGHLQSGAWQPWLFALFGAIFVVGLVLSWIGRPLGTQQEPT